LGWTVLGIHSNFRVDEWNTSAKDIENGDKERGTQKRYLNNGGTLMVRGG